MKTRSVVMGSFALLLALPYLAAALEVQPAGTASNPGVNPNVNSTRDLVTVQKPGDRPANAQPAAGILGEVEKLLGAGTDEQVIQEFIENWNARYYVTADQILHLHEIGASSEVLKALLKRSGELQAQAAAAMASLMTTNPSSMALPYANSSPTAAYPYASSYPSYTDSYLYPSAPYYGYRNPYWYSYYYYTWPWYPFYSYTWWSYPFYSHKYSHRYAHGFHHYPSWRNHGFVDGRHPGFGHGSHPGYVNGRSPGFHQGHSLDFGSQAWRPASSSIGGRSPGAHHFRSGGSVGFRNAGFSGRHSMGPGFSGRGMAHAGGFSGRGAPGGGFSGGRGRR